MDFATERKRYTEERRAADEDALCAVSDDALLSYLRKTIEAGKLQVVVPTIDSAAYIDIVLSYYRSIGIPVKVIVDAKTRDSG